jgi:hypothetical protein
MFTTDGEKKDMPNLCAKILRNKCRRILYEPLRKFREGSSGGLPMKDSGGRLRAVVPFLANYAGDLEELLELLGLGSNSCLHCLATYHDLDGLHICAPRTGASILETLSTL